VLSAHLNENSLFYDILLQRRKLDRMFAPLKKHAHASVKHGTRLEGKDYRFLLG
jgi:hypothetical protein